MAKNKKVSGGKSFMMIIFIIFFVLILLPFLPAIEEIVHPKDNKPLSINPNYIKDARYFDQSFKNILMKGIGDSDAAPGEKEVKLSKKEIVEIANAKNIKSAETITKILYIKGDLTSEKKVKFEKEIYVTGKAIIGEENRLRAILCEKDILLSRGTHIIRWVGSEGNIIASEKCNLGVRTSCGSKLEINKGCIFKSLFGKPVVTYNGHLEENSNLVKEVSPLKKEIDPKKIKELSDTAFVATRNFSIPPGSTIENDLIIKKDLLIKKESVINGSVKTYGTVTIQKDVKIYGDIFSDSDVIIGENCIITGNIFSQSRVIIASGVRVGNKGRVKSVIAKKELEIGESVVIYGYLLTEGKGVVV